MKLSVPSMITITKAIELPSSLNKKNDVSDRLKRSLMNSERVVEIASSISRVRS